LLLGLAGLPPARPTVRPPRKRKADFSPRLQIQLPGIRSNCRAGRSDTGSYEIRQLDEDAGAAPFQVGAGLRAKMFACGAIETFSGQDLDVHRKIAYLARRRSAGNPAPKSTKPNSTTR